MNLRPFTDHDWNGLGGATMFPSGEQPLLGEHGNNVLVVVDAEGIEVMLTGDHTQDVWHLNAKLLGQGHAQVYAKVVLDMVDFYNLAASLEKIGFTKIL